MSFWDIVWFIIITFCFMAYLMVLFHIYVTSSVTRRNPGS